MKLQKALCFHPVSSPTDKAIADDRALLSKDQSSWVTGSRVHSNSGTMVLVQLLDNSAGQTAHDFFIDSNMRAETLCNPFLHMFCKPPDQLMSSFVYDSDLVLARSTESSSWKKMYLTQPPISSVKVMSLPTRELHRIVARFGSSMYLNHTIRIVRLSGVTLGDLIDRIQERCEKDGKPMVSFSIEI